MRIDLRTRPHAHELSEGWGRPRRAAKAHYFVDGRSLCGRWPDFHGQLHHGRSLDTDCTMCNRHWRARGRVGALPQPVLQETVH